MPARPILRYGDPRLKTPCDLVTPEEMASEQFVADNHDLADTLASSRGAAISAPQIGWMKQVICVADQDDIKNRPNDVRIYTLVNPVLGEVRGPAVRALEGCLSFVDALGRPIYATVAAKLDIDVTWTDPSGRPGKATFTEFDARVIGHELDHLRGVLFISRMGKLERRMFLAQLAKSQKSRRVA